MSMNIFISVSFFSINKPSNSDFFFSTIASATALRVLVQVQLAALPGFPMEERQICLGLKKVLLNVSLCTLWWSRPQNKSWLYALVKCSLKSVHLIQGLLMNSKVFSFHLCYPLLLPLRQFRIGWNKQFTKEKEL